MQTYRAWSALSNSCVGTFPVEKPVALTIPPVTIVVPSKRRIDAVATKHAKSTVTAPPCPLTPSPAAPKAKCPLKPLTAEQQIAVSGWLKYAVRHVLTAPHAGSEHHADALEDIIDGGHFDALKRLRANGQLTAAIDAALANEGLSRRPDVPLERIIVSAMRRYELRPWINAMVAGRSTPASGA